MADRESSAARHCPLTTADWRRNPRRRAETECHAIDPRRANIKSIVSLAVLAAAAAFSAATTMAAGRAYFVEPADGATGRRNSA